MALRRQTYFLPTQITGCLLWLDGADPAGNGVVPANGATVSSWADKSGNGLTVSAASSQPTYSTNVVNNLGTVAFNGSQSLTAGSVTAGQLLGSTGTSAVFCVFSVSNNTLGSSPISWDDSSYTWRFIPFWDPSGIIVDLGNASAGVSNRRITISNSTLTFANNTYYLVSFWQSGGVALLNVNGGAYTATIASGFTGNIPTSTSRTFNVGGYVNTSAYNMKGNTAEVIIYNTHIPSNFQQVEAYLAQKWGLTGSLPAGHPGLTSILYRVQRPFFTKTPYFAVFSPRQITGCTLWLDGADSATTTSITSGVWVDKSGGGFNTSYVAGGTGLTMGSINRLPAVTFPGGDNNAINSSAATSTTNGFSIFFVASRSNSSPTGARFITNTSSSLQIYGIAPDIISTYVNNLFSSTSLTIITGVPFIFSLVVSPSTFSQWINGTVNSSTGTTGFASGTTIVIGASGTSYTSPFVFAGQMGEILVFNSAITTTERQQVESYLAQKWGLTLSLAAGHLNATFPAGSPAAIQPFISRIRPALSSIPFVGGGGTTSSSGSFTIRTFTSTTQLILSKAISATILVVGGGGGGGSAGVQTGGGGAGGAVFVSSPVTITAGTYTVTVGTGGGINTNGTNSTFLSYTGVGGGGGGNWINGAGKTGGCGGGGSGEGGVGAAGSQGFGGANGRGQFTCGGGGGGMGQAGKQPSDGSPSSGGNGLQYSITGSAVYYAGGGAGGFNSPSTGGLGGGGDKTVQGTDGLGGGGGSGARGGNGVVIISFVFI
jgi:hypothetical protein